MNTYNDRCPIWDTPANVTQSTRDGYDVDSPRAGGKYFCFRRAKIVMKQRSERAKIQLTDWLVEKRRLGEKWPEINEHIVEDVEKKRKKTPIDRADEILRYLVERSDKLGAIVSYSNCRQAPDHDHEARVRLQELLAYGSCADPDELLYLVHYLEHEGLIELSIDVTGRPNVNSCKLTVKGHSRLAALDSFQAISKSCFVAMWFGDEVEDAYTKGIEPAVKKTGFNPIRIDRKHHNRKIDDVIVAEIRRARFLVCDFTTGLLPDPSAPTRQTAVARGGVYYEAGLAHGLGKDVVWTCRRDLIDHVHFDLRQYSKVLWEDGKEDEFCNELHERIRAVIV